MNKWCSGAVFKYVAVLFGRSDLIRDRDSPPAASISDHKPARIFKYQDTRHDRYADASVERAHRTEGADDGVHSPMHKVRRNVGYLAYPRERNPLTEAAVSHFTLSGRTCCQWPRWKTWQSGAATRGQRDCDSGTVSLRVATQRVHTRRMRVLRAPPFAGPLGLCARLRSSQPCGGR